MTILDFLAGLIVIAVGQSLIMAIAFGIQWRTGNSGWIDTIWTFGVGSTGLTAALLSYHPDGLQSRQLVVATCIGIWSLRLGLHIAQRSAGQTDDPRYRKLSEEWGTDAPRELFVFLQQQAAVGTLLALTVFLAAHHPAKIAGVQDWIAIAIFVVAVAGEWLSDLQLRRFKSDPVKIGQVNDRGLWRYSRHPNYFFETLGWLTYPLLAIDVGDAYPWGWLTLAGPVCMYWVLVYVSGIPPLEQHMLRTRGDLFRSYQRRTNAFFPGPPRLR